MLNVKNVILVVVTANPLYEFFRQVEKMIVKILGVLRPMEKAALTSYANSPLVINVIALVEIPKRFTVPAMKLYYGMTDPSKHVTQYKKRMITTLSLCEMLEACMCKRFGSTLLVPAL